MYSTIEEANTAVIERIHCRSSFWQSVEPAKDLIPTLQQGKNYCMRAHL